ncbi:LysR family transcriptional regulator [Streptomyces sp. NPDC008343]|uniref:LysR family transcriptional regulator n=1 Tax=Streptomyces sp. NPDC008343 TaxID=3364828 RepID=UPI0036E99EBA
MSGAGPEADLVDVRLLRSFMAVAQELSFTRAGARLYLTQQAVSSQVRSLETSLGVQLFRRTTRSVRLTQAGRLLQERMQPIFRAMEEAIVEAREVSDHNGVPLVVGHTASAAHRLLPRAAGLLYHLSPELQLRSEQHTELGLRAAVDEGRVHLGVGLELACAGSRIASQEVGREPWCAVVGPQHPLALRGQVSTEELADHEWLSWPRSNHPGHWRAVHRLATMTDPRPAVTETWLAIAHTRLTATEAVMLQPLSFTAHPPQGLVVLEVENAPTCHFTAVWSTLATPPCLNAVLSALADAAAYPEVSTLPGRVSRLRVPTPW